MDKEYFKILIEKYLDGNASTAEVKELCEWIKNNDSLDRWIMQAIERSDSHLDEEVYERLYTRIKEDIESREKKSHRRFSFVPMLRWVAVVCLPIIAALAVYELGLDSKVDTLPLVVTAESGERAKVQLPDGTKVNINSASQISYPHDFNGERRIVELDGEAYFEVTSDSRKPFYVLAGETKVHVLGTAFNVSAYREDRQTEVALLRGKVSFDVKDKVYVLVPGEIATLNRESGETIVRKGDVAAIVDWKAGRFNFEDMSLEELTVKLSRWYGVTFVFSDEAVKKLRFSGAMTKYRTLDYVLDMISKTTDVTFSLKENRVTVSSKK
mgnify:CR=1 FL=1